MKRLYEFKKVWLFFLMVILIFSLSGCSSSGSDGVSAIQSYPIDSPVVTTTSRTIAFDLTLTDLDPWQLSAVPQYSGFGYGVWSFGTGLTSDPRIDIMPSAYSYSGVTQKAQLLRYFTISDIHITDKESPAQLIYLQQLPPYTYANVTSIYSPVMLYTTHVLDAAVQTVNALHNTNPFDFGLSLGDAANSTLYNEIRWYIDVIDGKVITPSSGAHLGASTIDYQKPYQAAGLDKSIPFYQTLGNHDHFFIGSNPVIDYLKDAIIGDTIIDLGNIFVLGFGVASRGYRMGTIDGSTLTGEIKYAGPVGDFSSPPTVVADPNRRSLTKKEWMSEFFTTTSNPVGHGFTQSNLDNDFACYSFQPNSIIPIKIIVLDDTQRDDDANYGGYGHGSLDQERYDWLINELDEGQADGQLMIIAAHIPIAVVEAGIPTDPLPNGSQIGWWSNAVVTQTALITKLQTYSNLIMWMAGHRHLNTVKAFISPDPTDHPEFGFWQVETSSLRDNPQQFRTFEIILNSDYTISIITTNVDPAINGGTPAAKSREYSVAARQIVKMDLSGKHNITPEDDTIKSMDPSGSYNATLYKQLSPAMILKMQSLYP